MAEAGRSEDGGDSALGRALRVLARLGQLALVGLVAYAVFVERSVGLVINTSLPLAIALIPVYVHRRYDFRFNPVLTLFVVVAAAFHSVGALGLYRSIGAFDQIAHGVAGALMAGIGYALLQVVESEYDSVVIPPRLRFAFVVIFAVAVGVAWEGVEFSLELAATTLGSEDALLSQYGLADVVLDLQYDLFGAVIVALWGTGYFDGVRTVLDEYVGPSGG
ncbi:hypothetical protein [Halosimplex salinum]|uniref:hypothetical protein n=1 Tax=Halosimplex salinum TaxID=1710538 RepID=UPI000F49718C|nr:hypothetical protein [Halosimplex salinum]